MAKAFRAWARLACLLVIGGCTTTTLPPIGAGGQAFVHEEDERRWWNRGKEVEDQLDRGGARYEDLALEIYLYEVAHRLLPAEVKAQGFSPRIKILQNPLLNAFALPHGVIYIHTGILARMEDEAQLATVLGHEMTHAVHRHAVRQVRQVQNRTAFLATLATISAAFGPYGQMAQALGALGTLAAVTGYSRDLEREADAEGLKWLVNAGYDLKRAPAVFELLQKDLDGEKVKEPFFFGTHPRLQERVENYTELLRIQYKAQGKAGGVTNRDAFLEKTHRLLLDNALLDLRMGRFNTAKASIDKVLKRTPEQPRAHYYLGEIYRQRGKPGDLEQAMTAYQQATLADPTYPDPYKGLGLAFYQQRMKGRAQSLFERYLALVPEAKDRAYIEGYVAELRREGSPQ